MDPTEEATARVAGRLGDFVESFMLNWPVYAAAIAIIVFAWLVAAIVGRIRLPKRITPNAFVASLVANAARAVILLVGFVVALDLIGATAVLGSVLGAAGVVGIAIGFAVRDVLENYLAGLLLSLRHPFSTTDLVKIEGHEGTVLRLTPRSTVLMGLDGNHIRIPNATVFKGIIINYTREPKRRFSFRVGVDVESDLVETRNVVMRALHGMDGILDDPAPMCNVQTLGDSNVVLFVAGWMDQSTHDFQRIRSEAIRLVKETLDEALIAMPEPIYNVRLSGPAAPETTKAPTKTPVPEKPDRPPRPAEETRANTERLRVAEEAMDEGDANLLSGSAAQE